MELLRRFHCGELSIDLRHALLRVGVSAARDMGKPGRMARDIASRTLRSAHVSGCVVLDARCGLFLLA